MLYNFQNLRNFFDITAPARSLLIGDEGDGDGGGGSGDDQPLTKGDVGKMIHTAIADRFRRLDLSAPIKKALDPALEEIRNALKPAPTPEGGDEGGEKATGDPRIDKLMGQLAEERKARLESEDQRKLDKAATLRAEEGKALQSALVEANVRPELIESAASYISNRGLVGRGDEGGIVWNTGDSLDPHVGIGDGVKQWAATDIGKAHVTSRPVKGSGNSGGTVDTKGGKGGEKMTDAELNRAILTGLP
jgi:hypothetical protein